MTCGGVCCVVEGSTPPWGVRCSLAVRRFFQGQVSARFTDGLRGGYGRFVGHPCPVKLHGLSGQSVRTVRPNCSDCPA